MPKRAVWQQPRLHFEEEAGQHRKVTWLELFFDLFFVVTIAQLAHHLTAHADLEGVFHFILLFVPVWWVWIGVTYYNERFESEGLENRLFTFAVMVPVIGLAVFAHDGLGHTFRGYIISYAVARAILILMWTRATWHNPEFRPTGKWIVGGFGVANILAWAAAFANLPIGYWLFGASLTVDLIAPLFTISHQQKLPRFSTSKLPERFGLFVIIVLGETVVGLVSGLARSAHLSVALFVEAAMGVAVCFGLWWIYFDFVARRPPKHGMTWAFFWGYLHMPLVMAIAATGAGIANVINLDGVLSESVRILISGALGTCLIIIGLLEGALQYSKDEPTHKIGSPLLKVAAGILTWCVGIFLPLTRPTVFLGVLIAILLSQMVYGAWMWFAQELPDEDIAPEMKC